MSACPIRALSAVTTPPTHQSALVTEGERDGLLRALSTMPDPRSPRGLCYPLAELLSVAVCAVMAGAVGHRHQRLAARPRRHRPGPARVPPRVPATSTMWRLLIRLDADLLATILADWLHPLTRPDTVRRPRYRQVIAIDGKTLRGARRADGSQVHLLSALDTTTNNDAHTPHVLTSNVVQHSCTAPATTSRRCRNTSRRCSNRSVRRPEDSGQGPNRVILQGESREEARWHVQAHTRQSSARKQYSWP